jgi:Mg/Co/Ni transporter MgtE
MADPLSLAFAERHPRDTARILERSALKVAAEFLESAAIDGTSAIAALMIPDAAAQCLAEMSPKAGARLLHEMPVSAAVEIVRRTDAATRDRLLRAIPRSAANKIEAGLNIPVGLVGAATDSHVVAVRQDTTAGEAAAKARALPERLQKYLYIVDDDGRLTGVLDTRELVLASPEQTVGALMRRNVISLPSRAPLDAVRDHHGWRSFHILPVVDRNGTFQGVVRARDLPKGPALRRGGDQILGFGGALFALADVFWAASADILVSVTRSTFDTGGTRRQP